ncbi:modulator of smoothened protein isoform X1 [Myotis myotis]|uniref:modulator of smoothened protein isoform X1 n=1 Tax=Myotis myotis TaxID=51298 RepID=UPI00174B4FA0|nr:modulator of smoothened protein isoform X1 [Myotis myotis]
MSLSRRRYLRHRQHRQPRLDQHRGVRGASQKRFRDLNSITELNNTVHPSGRQLGAAAVPADRGAGAGGPRRHLLQTDVAGACPRGFQLLAHARRREYWGLGMSGAFRALTVGLVRQCQTIHGRDRTCIPPRLPPEWVTTLFFIIMGIISLTVTCGLLVASHWRREATKYARWIAFTGSIQENPNVLCNIWHGHSPKMR